MLNNVNKTVETVVNKVIEASKEAVEDVIWVYDREGFLVPKYIQKTAMVSGEDNPRGWR